LVFLAGLTGEPWRICCACSVKAKLKRGAKDVEWVEEPGDRHPLLLLAHQTKVGFDEVDERVVVDRADYEDTGALDMEAVHAVILILHRWASAGKRERNLLRDVHGDMGCQEQIFGARFRVVLPVPL
jgi:hypothetical protein